MKKIVFILSFIFLFSGQAAVKAYDHFPGEECGSNGRYDCDLRCVPEADIVNAQINDRCDYTAPVNLDCGAYNFDWGKCGSNIVTHRGYWWYDPSHPGTGVSIENFYGTLAVGLFMYYDDSHKPMWLSATCSEDNATSFSYSGNLFYWTGWPLGSSYYSPVPHKVGNISIAFSHSQADVTYTITEPGKWLDGGKIDQVGQAVTVHLKKFLPSIVSSDKKGSEMPINGWWWNPRLEGMGIFFEEYHQTGFMAWYHYGPDGLPRWYTCDGQVSSDQKVSGITHAVFTCNMREWTGGSSIGSANYSAPTPVSIGTATLTFRRVAHLLPTATLVSPVGTYDLERFTLSRNK